MSNSNLDYKELENIQTKKILYFCAKIGFNDVKYAEKYLIQANWDEKAAVEIFYSKHPNHNPSELQHHNQDSNNQVFQPQFAPPSQISSNRNRRYIQNENEKSNKNDYLMLNIGEDIINNKNNNGQNSEYLYYLKTNLKGIESNYITFLKLLKIKSGVILFFKEESYNKIKEQIKKINTIYSHDCAIFPVLKQSPIGNELSQQLSIVSSPCYLFCKYKDNKNFYLTDRMEGAFDIDFFEESIRKIKPEVNNHINSNNKKSKLNNNKNNENSNNENSNNIIKNINIKNNNYFNQGNPQKQKNVNNKSNNNKNQINNKNVRYNNIKDNKNKNNNPINPNMPPMNNNDYSNFNNNNINYNDFYLGNSVDIPYLFNENNNVNPHMNNNFINPNSNMNPNLINNNNHNYVPNNNNINNEDINNNPNELADSIYQLSDAQVLAKREKEMRELERQQEEKEKKEKEERMKELEEEKRIKKLNQEYDKKAESAKKKLSQEPDDDDPDACHIIFKSPNGEKMIKRRFFKTDTIESLYIYVKSIGRDIFTEPDSNDFDILSSDFPPKNLQNKKNNTLEEEGLFPNSMLQIREK